MLGAPPCQQLWDALQSFAERVKAKGLEVQRGKSACWRPDGGAIDGKPVDLPIGTPGHYGFEVVGETREARAEGLCVYNVPIGTAAFVQGYLHSKAARIGGNFSKLQAKLQPVSHAHYLWTSLYYSASRQFDFWLRNSFPRDVEPHAVELDGKLVAAVSAAWQVDVRSCTRALRRLRLPVRCKGGGIRDLAELCHSAFVGGLAASLPYFLDGYDADGRRVRTGLFPGLVHVFGDRAYADGEEEALAQFVSIGSPTAVALAESWAELQRLAGLPALAEDIEAEADVCEALRLPVAVGAAHPTVRRKGQHTLTLAVERHAFRTLDAEFRALPNDHRERWLWQALDESSRGWLLTLPDSIGRLESRELAEVAARYFFLPSPALQPFVGKRVMVAGAREVTCRPYGDEL